MPATKAVKLGRKRDDRQRRRRFLAEVKRLNPKEEQAMAEEGMQPIRKRRLAPN